MAEAIYPGEFQNKHLHNFINHPSLAEYAKKAEGLLDELPMVFVPRIQYKRPGVKNTCWYVALKAEPDIWLVNFTIIPSNLNIEFRLPKYFIVKEEHKKIYGMQYQNNLPTFGLKTIGSKKALELLSEYIVQVTPDVLARIHKSASRSSAEYFIIEDLKKLYPNHKIRHGERPIRSGNGSFLELDVMIKEMNFAIEIQGPTHYPESDIYGNYNQVKKRDEYKAKWCKEHGINLMHLDWAGYMKTIYREHESARQKYLGVLIERFLQSDEIFTEITEGDLKTLMFE